MHNNVKKRYFTKSLYKLAMECPTKLFYTGKTSYADTSIDDPFLKALARGGFQVGALARAYFPDGIEIKATQPEAAAAETKQHLDHSANVTLFEAALEYNGLFIRADILHKQGDHLELIEVKSKSFDPSSEQPFFDKTALKRQSYRLTAEFAPYLYDVAFQAYVCAKAYPSSTVSAFLMLPNKSAVTSVDGLNQLFLLKNAPSGRPHVVARGVITKSQLGGDILVKVPIDDVVSLIHASRNAERPQTERCQGLSYEEEITYLAAMYQKDMKVSPQPGTQCKHCEFRAVPHEGQASGFKECWQSQLPNQEFNLKEGLVFDIWNFRGAKKLLEAGKTFQRQLSRDDICTKEAEASNKGLSVSERQWLQVSSTQTLSQQPYCDQTGLLNEVLSWTFPLHFIDFETTMVAIPFTKGRRPYEQVAFQFSEHTVQSDGTVAHQSQYLHLIPGVFPNFDFLRALKRSLEQDNGTIFRYAAHENTVLCQIYEQLRVSNEPDAEELMSWIRSVTTSTARSAEQWQGPRSMVDLCDLVRKYYYHPLTNGSNSIKKVLPAVLAASPSLQQRYAQPLYGSATGIKSLNFVDWAWVEHAADGQIKDPYKRLPSLYQGLDRHQLDLLLGEDELADGGAAMTAYAMMQFTEMSAEERNAITAALLRYCELDTFAMVLLYQYWTELLGVTKINKVA